MNFYFVFKFRAHSKTVISAENTNYFPVVLSDKKRIGLFDINNSHLVKNWCLKGHCAPIKAICMKDTPYPIDEELNDTQGSEIVLISSGQDSSIRLWTARGKCSFILR